MQSVNKICKKKFHQKIIPKLRPEHNLYWKNKFLKQATDIGYVTAKLSKSVQITMLTSLESFLQRILGK